MTYPQNTEGQIYTKELSYNYNHIRVIAFDDISSIDIDLKRQDVVDAVNSQLTRKRFHVALTVSGKLVWLVGQLEDSPFTPTAVILMLICDSLRLTFNKTGGHYRI